MHPKGNKLAAVFKAQLKFGRHDTEHNDIQHNDIQHKGLMCDTQHK